MAIKIVLTDEDALAWAARRAMIGEIIPVVEHSDAEIAEAAAKRALHNADPETRHAVAVIEPVKRSPGRPRREPVPKDEAGPVIPLAAEVVIDADPLLDAGKGPSVDATPMLVTGVADDLDLRMPVSDDLMTAIVEISDGELQAAAAKFCTTKREPGNRTFRVILGKYATQVADIPQDRRQAFLGELKAVT